MMIPPKLKFGDKVAIVAPAKRLQSEIESGISKLESWGLEVEIGKHVHDEDNLFAGHDDVRLSDLQDALDNPEIKAVFMARGGYGTTRILDRLNLEHFLNQPKWICGFSDITVLLQRLVNQGIASVHSTVGSLIGQKEHEDSDESLRKAVFGESLNYDFQNNESNRLGTAQGVVVGGNLSMICNSIGTSSEIDTVGNILFLEEVGEYLYHLDRMLVQLKRAGKFEGLAGLVLGYFTHMKDHQDTFGLSVNEIIMDQLSGHDLPVAFDFPGGHEAPNLALYFGKEARLTVARTHSTLNYETG